MSGSPHLIGHEHPAWPTDLTYRQLNHWTKRGYLHAHNPGAGTGHAQLWPRREADVAALILRLTSAGMMPSAAANIARLVVASDPHEPFDIVLAPGIVLVIGPINDRSAPTGELVRA